MSSVNLASSISELPDINKGLMHSKYVQVAPSRDCTGSNFPNGGQYYNFSVSGSTWWCPSKSFLRLRVKYTAADGTTQLLTDDQITPNPMMCANLFDSCEFRMGSTTICRVGENVPQVSAFKYRLGKSKSWLDTIGEQSDFCSADDTLRQSEVVSDVVNLGLTVGDADGIRESEVLRKAKELDCIWQPPLSIFEVKGCLPSGQYSLILNPSNIARYQLNSILSDTANKTATDFKFEVTDIYFYVHTIDGESVSNKTYALDLMNVDCQVQKIEGSGLTQRYFNVSPSTTKLAVAYQDSRVNSDTRSSASYFTSSPDAAPLGLSKGEEQNKLSRFYLSYANQQKPQPDANPEYSNANARDRLGERYNETLLESGLYFNPAGSESYAEWKRRGLLMLYSFQKSGDDASTRVQVNQQFNSAEIANMNVLLFSVSHTSVQVTVSNGQIAMVEAKER